MLRQLLIENISMKDAQKIQQPDDEEKEQCALGNFLERGIDGDLIDHPPKEANDDDGDDESKECHFFFPFFLLDFPALSNAMAIA
jgi:hypothetical protein